MNDKLKELMKQFPLSQKIQKDLRDYKYSEVCPTSSKNKKKNYALKNPEWKYPILNQNPYGMCQAYALIEQVSAIKGRYYDVNEMFSAGWLYFYRQANYSQGRGLGTTNGFNTCIKYGLVLEKDFPTVKNNYPNGKDCINSSNIDKLLSLASKNKMEAYVEIEPDELAEFMSTHDYNPVNLIIRCYENFYDCLKTHEFPYEGKGKELSAHAVTIKGLFEKDGHVYASCVNHWGKEYGDNGIFNIRLDSPTIYSIKGFIDKREMVKIPDSAKGWQKIYPNHPGGLTKWKYVKDDLSYAKNEWIQLGKDWFYFGNDEFAYQEQWLLYKNKWYYFDDNCYMVTNKWIYDKDKWYRLGTDGAMLTGWFKDDNGKYCYLDIAKGYAYCNCAILIDGKYYTFDEHCYLVE